MDGPKVGGQRLGQIDIARPSISAGRRRAWPVMVSGGGPSDLYAGRFRRPDVQAASGRTGYTCEFIGGAYGFRTDVVGYLKKHGVSIETFGRVGKRVRSGVSSRSRLSIEVSSTWEWRDRLQRDPDQCEDS